MQRRSVLNFVLAATGVACGLVFAASLALAALPGRVDVGAETIHRYEEPQVSPSMIAITVWVPMPAAGQPGGLLNSNALEFPRDLSARWIMGDGGVTRALVGIDLSPGSPLSLWVEAFYRKAIASSASSARRDQLARVLEYVRVNVNCALAWTDGAQYNDGRSELPWDLAIRSYSDMKLTLEKAAYLPVLHEPIPSEHSLPVVGLEKYLEIGKGYCIQKAILASLILSRAGIRHRLVNGAVVVGPGVSGGHTWIELADGRILDVAWELLAKPARGHRDHADWINVGGSWRFENQAYLILRLP
jgi:hypothetical protein